MHPTVVHYLSLEAAQRTLSREDRGEPLSPEERAFAEAARAAPGWRGELAAAGSHPSKHVQEALLVIAAQAAARLLRGDPRVGPALAEADAAMRQAGAGAADVERAVAALVLEEAFGDEESPDEFDEAFFLESVGSLGPLASLTRERVDALVERFSGSAPEGWKAAYGAAARALLEAAWPEGAQPVNPEHVQEAAERVLERVAAPEGERALEALRRFLEALHHEGLVGGERLRRLSDAVNAAALELSRGADPS